MADIPIEAEPEIVESAPGATVLSDITRDTNQSRNEKGPFYKRWKFTSILIMATLSIIGTITGTVVGLAPWKATVSHTYSKSFLSSQNFNSGLRIIYRVLYLYH